MTHVKQWSGGAPDLIAIVSLPRSLAGWQCLDDMQIDDHVPTIKGNLGHAEGANHEKSSKEAVGRG